MKKNILAINGSASVNSSNLSLLKYIEQQMKEFEVQIFNSLTELPHFRTELTDVNTPGEIIDFRELIRKADGIIICTPEYIFSLPSGLKNAIEWCVSTVVFSGKPTGLITASASGEKGHEELQRVMKTVEAKFSNETTLLIQGVRGKVKNGEIVDEQTKLQLKQFIEAYRTLVA